MILLVGADAWPVQAAAPVAPSHPGLTETELTFGASGPVKIYRASTEYVSVGQAIMRASK